MTENEISLVEMIRNNENPAQAFVTATEIILGCLKLLEPSELTHSADSRVSVEINQA